MASTREPERPLTPRVTATVGASIPAGKAAEGGAAALTPKAFAEGLERLRREHAARRDNERCIACADCSRCSDCTFCKGSRDLARCNYCVDCEGCVDSNHCSSSRALVGCIHCHLSERCSRSAYVERSVDCDDCRYCFGCVGLSGKEFHVLNRPYPRSEYFRLTAELKRQLR